MKTSHGAFFRRARLFKLLDATLGFCLCWILGYLQYLLIRNKRPISDLKESAPLRMLVVRPGGMGDMVLLLPVIRRLTEEFPAASIDVVCERRNIEVLRIAGLEKNAIRYDTNPLRFLRRLLRQRYDVALDTEQFHHFSAVIAFLSRAPMRIGFKINPNRNLLYTHLINYALDGYEGIQFMRLLEPLGVNPRGKPLGIENPEYRLDGILSEARLELPHSLQQKLDRLQAYGTLIAVHVGSTTVYKQWGAGKFIRLVQTLASKEGQAVVLVGARGDQRDADFVLRHIDNSAGKIVSYAGKLTLPETAAMIKAARLFVGGDSGLAHLAIALGVPTVVMFGPSDPAKWGLADARHEIVRKALACSPCFIFGYHKLCRTLDCMAKISVEDVLNACNRLLGKP